MAATEVIYLGHDNSIDLLLKADDAAVDLSSVTKITATFGDLLVESTDKAAGVITWDQSGYDTGEIRLAVGGVADMPTGKRDVPIVVYDATNTDGIVWGEVNFSVLAEVEGS